MSNFSAIEKPIIDGLQNPEGKGIPVIFYERAVYNEEKSKAENRPVYENKVYVKKHYDSLTCYDNRAEQSDFDQFPRQYQRFVSNKKSREQGVPVGMLPTISPSDVKMCEDMGLYTVEKLAECEGGVAEIVGDLKSRAATYLDQASEMQALKKENAKLKKELAKLKGEGDEPTNNRTKRGRRNATVREANDDNKQQQQGS